MLTAIPSCNGFQHSEPLCPSNEPSVITCKNFIYNLKVLLFSTSLSFRIASRGFLLLFNLNHKWNCWQNTLVGKASFGSKYAAKNSLNGRTSFK